MSKKHLSVCPVCHQQGCMVVFRVSYDTRKRYAISCKCAKGKSLYCASRLSKKLAWRAWRQDSYAIRNHDGRKYQRALKVVGRILMRSEI